MVENTESFSEIRRKQEEFERKNSGDGFGQLIITDKKDLSWVAKLLIVLLILGGLIFLLFLFDLI